MVNRQSHKSISDSTKGTPLQVSVEKRNCLNKQGSDSETDHSSDLIPQVSEGNKLPAALSVDTQQANDVTKSVQDKKELSKTQPTSVFTDSSLSDSDSDTITTSKVGKGGKIVEDELKSTTKKRTSRKAVQEQV